MKETKFQAKIMEGIDRDGGHSVNGIYTKSGEADIQSGYPVKVAGKKLLIHLCVEVKTKLDYERVMSALEETDGQYEIIDRKKLKEHEPLQVVKVNKVRRLGGLALFAYSYHQVVEYVKEHYNG
jgi:hypothetical protein